MIRMFTEPRWRTRRCLRGVPPSLASWLFEDSSLTSRLQRACDGAFAVRVLAQGWGRPRLGEAQTLAARPEHWAWIREVHLLCSGRPWVFARTVIPPMTLRGAHGGLARLGSRPLGEVLFSDPSMRRGEIEVACLPPGQRTYPGAAAEEAVWGRRSLFFLRERPLLVHEFFLPETDAEWVG